MRFTRSRKTVGAAPAAAAAAEHATADPSPSPPPPPPPQSSPSDQSPSARSFGSHVSSPRSTVSKSTTVVFEAADADANGPYDEEVSGQAAVMTPASPLPTSKHSRGPEANNMVMMTPPPSTASARKSISSSSPKMPKLLVLIELNEWDRVAERAHSRPREAAMWTSVRKGRPAVTPSTPAGGRAVDGPAAGSSSTPERQVHTVKCKALHHACMKLRSVHALPCPPPSSSLYGNAQDAGEERDPYVAACKAILALVEAHPQAAGERESRHGCLPLHLAVFGMGSSTTITSSSSSSNANASGYISSPSPATSIGGTTSTGGSLLPMGARPTAVGRGTSVPVDLDASFEEAPSSELDDVLESVIGDEPQQEQDDNGDGEEEEELTGPIKTCKSDPQSLAADSLAACMTGSRASSSRPPKMPQRGRHRRGHSHDSRDYSIMGMSQMISAEQNAGIEVTMVPQQNSSQPNGSSAGVDNNSTSTSPVGQQRRQYQQSISRPTPLSVQDRAKSAPVSKLSPSMPQITSTSVTSTRRDHYSLLVCNALLDAYPRAIKTDSEGGRMPLHIAISGQASAKVIRTLVRAYPDAARQRTKDGYLPLHLAAHWGVSSLDVVSALMKAYPDAVVGRNRWERTPLEEALVMAGENGRANQAGLVRALRKNPNYWATAGATAELNSSLGTLNLGGGHPTSGGGMSDLQGLLSPGSGGNGRGQGAMKPSSTLVDVDASFDDDSEDYATGQNAPASSGFMSRLSPRTPKGKPAAMVRSATDAQLDAAKAFAARTDLVTLIRTHSFSSIPHRIRLHPEESSNVFHCTVRGGYPAKVTPLYLLCENSPPVDVVDLLIAKFQDGCETRKMPGGQLPLHAACTWLASADVIERLLKAYPSAAQQRDDLSNLPLHCACFSGTSPDAINALLEAYPRGVLVRNSQGSAPSDIVKRLRHPNRSAVLLALSRFEEKMMTKAKHTERTSIARPTALHQDQRQESIETMLRCGSASPQSLNSTGTRKGEQHPGSASSSPLGGGSKVFDTRASPPNAEASEEDMLWV